MIRQASACCLSLWLTLGLSSCVQTPDYLVSQQHQSPNHNQRIRMVVLHYTTGDWGDSLRVLTEPSDHPVSAHYLIPERLDPSYPVDEVMKVYQLVGEQQRAWHAGDSRWEGKTSLNDQSIGIELVNRSQCYAGDDGFCLTPDFDPAQMELLAKLLKDILRRHPEITATRVLGHSDIVPERKQDPGPRFPWQWLARQGIGAWFDDQTVLKYWQLLPEKPPISLVQQGLQRYGYGIEITGEHDQQTKLYLMAFQRHFVPDQVHGNADRKTVAILFALLEKYFPQSLKTKELQLPAPANSN